MESPKVMGATEYLFKYKLQDDPYSGANSLKRIQSVNINP